MFKVDLHTHSDSSPDGGITLSQYKKMLDDGALDVIAVTDHDQISRAQAIQAELGDKIVVGEEIMTTAGEIIGLYLTERVAPLQTPLETVKQIKEQGGLVYIPHPFESVRKGVHPATLEELIDYVDIIEVCNGRAFMQNRSSQAVVWARINQMIGASSSDAHGPRGLGKTYTSVQEIVTRDNLLQQLAGGTMITARPNVRSLLYPKYHRLRKKVGKTS